MQSSNYVPGVSGWKIDPASGAFEMASDQVAVVGTDLKAIYSGKSQPKEPKPFVVIDGVTYISQALIQGSAAKVVADNIASMWSVKLHSTADGRYVATGAGVGVAANSGGGSLPDIIVKASNLEILSDGMVRIKQATN
jgi:hypothetical protein